MVNEFLLETLREEGKRLKIPPHKDRALIREYLQTKIIYYLYGFSLAEKLSFIGGTSLRILRDLDRFSEDLDFDNLGLNFRQIKPLFLKIKNALEKEGFEMNYEMKKTNDSGIGELKFEELLFKLGISSHSEEKLSIRLNYTTPKTKPKNEILVLNRFGMVQNVLTNTAEFLLSQKIRAILIRKDPQPRDFYDLVWFLSQRIKPDQGLFSEIKVKNEKEICQKLEKIYFEKIKPKIKIFKKRLAPFLIDERKVYYLDVFPEILKKELRD